MRTERNSEITEQNFLLLYIWNKFLQFHELFFLIHKLEYIHTCPHTQAR